MCSPIHKNVFFLCLFSVRCRGRHLPFIDRIYWSIRITIARMCWGRLFARFNKEREKSEKISKPDRQIDKQITFYQFRLRSKSKCQHLPINFSWRLRVISFECKFQSTFFHFLTTMQINIWKNFWWKRKKIISISTFLCLHFSSAPAKK